jgi:hypothetical protein
VTHTKKKEKEKKEGKREEKAQNFLLPQLPAARRPLKCCRGYRFRGFSLSAQAAEASTPSCAALGTPLQREPKR